MSHDNELSPWQLNSIAPFGQALVVTGAPKRLGMAEWECIQDVAALRCFTLLPRRTGDDHDTSRTTTCACFLVSAAAAYWARGP